MPHVPGGDYLLNYLFRFGPTKKESPLEPQDIREWGQLLGIEWKPWQAELLIRLSRDYFQAQYEAKSFEAPPPWDGAAKMWGWVRAQQTNARVKEMLDQKLPKEKTRNGNRQ